MSSQKGSLLLLKIKLEEEYKTLGGMRTTKIILNNQLTDSTSKSSNGWRELLEKSGVSHMTISVTGIFTDSQSEKTVRDLALRNKIADYQICFGNGDIINSKFQISSYERAGDYDQEENYNISLESSGEIKFSSQDQ